MTKRTMKYSKIRLAAAAFACISLVGFSGCRRMRQPAVNRPAGTSSGWALDDGQHATVANYKGKVLLLDFYATWCDPCRRETPSLVALHQKYAAQGLEVIGLNVGGEDDYEQVPAFKQEFGIQFPLAVPDDDFVDQFLGVNLNIPQTFVIDRQGSVVKHFVGYGEGRAAEVERAVQAALQTQ